MDLREKQKVIKENKEKEYLHISTDRIGPKKTLIDSHEALELYIAMDENTTKFAEKTIVDLMTTADANNQGIKTTLNFQLIFCGSFDDIPSNLGNPIDFILNNSDRIIAIYKYIERTEVKQRFVGSIGTYSEDAWGYQFLNLGQLLKMFEEYGVSYEIGDTINKWRSSRYKDHSTTIFTIGYEPKKELESCKDDDSLKLDRRD